MIASNSRTYINRIINECNPDYTELNFSFDPEGQTPETLSECSYQLQFLDIVNVNEGTDVVEDDAQIDVTFMRNGYQCEIETHETFIDEIYCIRNALVNLTNYDSGIVKVSAVSFSITPLDTADTIMVIKMQLLIKFNYCLN